MHRRRSKNCDDDKEMFAVGRGDLAVSNGKMSLSFDVEVSAQMGNGRYRGSLKFASRIRFPIPDGTVDRHVPHEIVYEKL